MLVNSVIIILREVLEAALIISVLLAISQQLKVSRQWIFFALAIGIVGSSIYATYIEDISMAMEGVGQEVVNGSLHLLIYSFIIMLIFSIRDRVYYQLMLLAMVSCVVMATIREGAEIIIYISGFISSPELLLTVSIGSIVGTGIGISIGVFFYYLITSMSFNKGIRLALFLLILIAGAMILQATQLFIQADIISSQQPLWNSSSLISERSLFGQMLYALLGYEATPTPIQVICYIASLFLMTFMTFKTLRYFNQRGQL